MRRRGIIATGAIVTFIATTGWIAAAQQGSGTAHVTFLGDPVTAAQLALGQQRYSETCAACHGANLEGQPDWHRRNDDGRMPAPPHDATGHTWHHADGDLFTITKLGIGAIVPGYESDMPAYEGILADDEIAATLAYIKSTWPERERSFQAEVTANDPGGS